MNPKFLLLLVAIVAIGIIVLPETLAMFAGQHNMYDTIATGNQVPCQKCHADIASELNQPGSVNAVHNAQGCEGCHVTVAPGKEGLTKGVDFHASALPLCLDCHDGSVGKDARTINASGEAHKNFYNSASNFTVLKGGNEACIACHSHIQVNITWQKYTTMNLVEDQDKNVINVTGAGSATLTTSG